MTKINFNELQAFFAVARAGSFTKAAALLGLSQSALSHNMRGLEERMGVRLLTRTTRRVAPTDLGEQILRSIAPRLEEIEAELASICDLAERPAGLIRLTATEYACETIIMPRLAPLLRAYPDIHLEVVIDYGLTDIVTERFDAGIRTGGQVAKDMIAVRVAPDMSMAVVGSPSYFASRPAPRTPQDLIHHTCINLRLPTHGGTYAWEFDDGPRNLRVRVDGQVTFNASSQMISAALEGLGLAYVPDGAVDDHIKSGRLVRALQEWCQPFTGYHLYYPSRRQSSPAFKLMVEALRYRG